MLHGAALRTGLCSDLGLSPADRRENIRRLAEGAWLLTQAAIPPIVAAISPYAEDRRKAHSMLPIARFLEVHVDTPLAVCEQRDPKGLCARARRGRLQGMTGLDAPCEAPSDPELRLSTPHLPVDECVARILALLDAPA